MNKEMKNNIMTALVVIALFAVILFSAWILVQALNLTSLQKLGAFIVKWKTVGPLILIALAILAALTGIIPSFPLALLSGAIWGVPLGTIYMVIGTQIGASLSFLISRYAAYPFLDKYLGKHIRIYKKISEKYLTIFIFVSRLLPIFVFELISYGAGLTRIKFWHYFWATLLGIIPSIAFFAWSGESLIQEGSIWLTAITIATLILIVAFPVLIQKYDLFGLKKKILT